jgi:hypothetical protein
MEPDAGSFKFEARKASGREDAPLATYSGYRTYARRVET